MPEVHGIECAAKQTDFLSVVAQSFRCMKWFMCQTISVIQLGRYREVVAVNYFVKRFVTQAVFYLF